MIDNIDNQQNNLPSTNAKTQNKQNRNLYNSFDNINNENINNNENANNNYNNNYNNDISNDNNNYINNNSYNYINNDDNNEENNIISNNNFIRRNNGDADENNVFDEINERNLIQNDILNNPVIHAPPIGFGQLISVESQPTKVEHLFKNINFNENLNLKLNEKYAAKEKKIEGTLISNNTIKFEFDNEDVIDPESMVVEIEIANPNKYNYLQIDNSPHSLIKTTKWIYRDKIIENINDYHVLLSFLNDKEYKTNKYNKNIEHFKNENEEVMPLTYGTREELLHPKVYGTEFIFNNSVVQSSYIKKHDIVDGLIDMRPKSSKVFEIPIFSYIFGTGPSKKADLLPLKLFKGLQLYITLNEFAFFVPCFNATINELVNVSDKDDIAFESYYNFMSDYNTIKKMEMLIDENEKFCKFDLDEKFEENDKMDLDLYLADDEKFQNEFEDLSKNLSQYYNNKTFHLNFLETTFCLLGRIYNQLSSNNKPLRAQNFYEIFTIQPIDQHLLLDYFIFLMSSYCNLRNKFTIDDIRTFKKADNNLNDDYNNIIDSLNFKCLGLIKEDPINSLYSLLDDDTYIFDETKAKSIIACLHLFEKRTLALGSINTQNNYPGNTLLDINLIDFSGFNFDRMDMAIKKEYAPSENEEFIQNEFIDDYMNYRNNIKLYTEYRDFWGLNNKTINKNKNYEKTKTFIFFKDKNKMPTFVIDNTYNVYFNPPKTPFYLSLYSNNIIEIKHVIGEIYKHEVVFETKKTVGGNPNNYHNSDIKSSLSLLTHRNDQSINKAFAQLFKHLECSPLEFLIPDLMILFAKIKKPHQYNLKNWLILLLFDKFKNDYLKIYKTEFPNLFTIIENIPYAIIKNKYNYERKNLKKNLDQCVEEYKKLNEIKNKYNVIVSREYDLVSYNFSYIAYRNKDGTNLKVNSWSGTTKYYIMMDKREFNTHPPSKLYCYMPSNNVINIYQIIISDAYKAYPTCRFSSRYNRKIKNYWIETEFGNYPNEINKEDNTSFTENNFIYQRLKSCFNIKESLLNNFNTSIDNNTQLYITKKLNGEESNLILFSDYANQHDNFLFGYFTEINSKCILGFNINKMKRELKLENKALKEFYIRIQTDIPYNKKDSFNNFELYTYAEGFIHFDFDEFGNLKTKNIIQ